MTKDGMIKLARYRVERKSQERNFSDETVLNMKRGYETRCERYESKIKKLETQIEKMKKYGKLLQDICDVMGNDPYMVWRGLEQRVLILWDKSEEEKGLKMADDILERLLKISAIDWAEIEKWEIKENGDIESLGINKENK